MKHSRKAKTYALSRVPVFQLRGLDNPQRVDEDAMPLVGGAAPLVKPGYPERVLPLYVPQAVLRAYRHAFARSS